MAAVDVFLGGILKVSQIQYAITDRSDGTAVISMNPEGQRLFSMEFKSDAQVEGLVDGTKKYVTFKVDQRKTE